MQIDTTLGELSSAGPDARAAEAAGYAGAFTGEVSSDPFLPLALAAEATTRLELGTSIAVAFARSPMTLAYTAYDLQRFSQGRFILGLGTQVKAHIVRRFAMPWSKPAARMREFVLALRAAWAAWDTGSPLAFEGEFYQHTLMPPMFMPTPHDYAAPQVFVAGVGDAMTRVAGEVADGFLAHAFTTERWLRERTLPALREGRHRVGKTLDGFTVKAAVFVVTGSDEEIKDGCAAVRSQLAFYASTPAYKPVLDLHGWGAVGDELTRLSKAGQWEQMSELIDDDMLSAFAVIAPLDEVRDRVQSRCSGVIDRVSFLTAAPQRLVLEALRS
jgi:probable F420-dependent oxidoreductase